MTADTKAIESLRVSDLRATPVWEYVNCEGADETAVRAVKRVPVQSLDGRLVGTEVELANGARVWALIGNIDADDPRLTEHFITLSVERNGQWFTLARYHDVDYAENGPEALARFLGLPVGDMFPISYDVRKYVRGDPAALAGKVLKEPREKLSRAEIIALAVP